MSEPFGNLAAAVAEFQNWVKLPKLSHLSAKLMYEFTEQSVWADQYKVNAGLPGCYVFEDANGELVYVGSVSGNEDFGRRFAGSYVRKHPADATKVEQLGNAVGARKIYVVDVTKEYAFIAPALEQFLISYLNPRLNAKGCVRALREQLISDGRIQIVND